MFWRLLEERVEGHMEVSGESVSTGAGVAGLYQNY
jgi:hypothetical protein